MNHYQSRGRLVRLLSAIALCVLATLSAPCQELTAEQKAKVDKIINIQRNLSSGHSNSPGAELHAKEVSRAGKRGDLVLVGYALYAAGLTSDRYELVSIPITAEAAPLVEVGADLSLAQDGQVMDGPNDPRIMLFPNFVRGEPARLGLISKDGKERAFVTILPNPITASDHGCTLNVVRLLPRFEIAFVEGTGFPPEADIDFESNSSGEVHNGKVRTDTAGYVQTGIIPFVKDKDKGQLQITLVAPHCKPKVRFTWGTTSE